MHTLNRKTRNLVLTGALAGALFAGGFPLVLAETGTNDIEPVLTRASHAQHRHGAEEGKSPKGGCKHRKGQGGQVASAGKSCRKGGHDQGCRSAGKHLYGAHWESSLSDEQKAEMDALRVRFAKLQAPIRARTEAVQVELAALATADAPDVEAIEQKIAEFAELKRERMAGRYAHIAAKRQLLTEEQRISFDMELLRKAGDRD